AASPGTGGATAGEPAEARARWLLRTGFGVLWIFDGILQAQPKMAGGLAGAATVWIQVGIGTWLIVAVRGPWSRLAGSASVTWGLIVWVFGRSEEHTSELQSRVDLVC